MGLQEGHELTRFFSYCVVDTRFEFQLVDIIAMSFPQCATAHPSTCRRISSGPVGFPFYPYNAAVSGLPTALSLPDSHVCLSHYEPDLLPVL